MLIWTLVVHAFSLYQNNTLYRPKCKNFQYAFTCNFQNLQLNTVSYAVESLVSWHVQEVKEYNRTEWHTPSMAKCKPIKKKRKYHERYPLKFLCGDCTFRFEPSLSYSLLLCSKLITNNTINRLVLVVDVSHVPIYYFHQIPLQLT